MRLETNLLPVPHLSAGDAPGNEEKDGGYGTQTLAKPDQQVKEPSFYKVLLLNDDFTPMDFVTHVLMKFFRKSRSEAETVMMQVHTEGAGTAGVYAFDVAETKVYVVNDFSRKHRHPLQCIMEKAD